MCLKLTGKAINSGTLYGCMLSTFAFRASSAADFVFMTSNDSLSSSNLSSHSYLEGFRNGLMDKLGKSRSSLIKFQ